MKRIDKLIKKAKKLVNDMVKDFFAPNDDEFLEALGVDPEKYKHVAPNGTVGYDFMSALNDTAAESWSDYVTAPESEIIDNGAEGVELYHGECKLAVDCSEDPRKHHSWNVLTAEEQEMALQIYAEMNGVEITELPEVAERTEAKAKNKKLFGWG